MLVIRLTCNNSWFSTGLGNVLCHDTLLSHQQIWTGIQAVDTNLCLRYKLSSLCRTAAAYSKMCLFIHFLFYQNR